MKRLLQESWTYKFYKFMQEFANIYYSKLVLSLVLILSLLSNTLFSLGYIVVLCVIMYNSQLTLDVHASRTTLKPILEKFVLPYMIFEISTHLIYALPIDLFDPDQPHDTFMTLLPNLLGLNKYYTIVFVDNLPTLVTEPEARLI